MHQQLLLGAQPVGVEVSCLLWCVQVRPLLWRLSAGWVYWTLGRSVLDVGHQPLQGRLLLPLPLLLHQGRAVLAWWYRQQPWTLPRCLLLPGVAVLRPVRLPVLTAAPVGAGWHCEMEAGASATCAWAAAAAAGVAGMPVGPAAAASCL